MGSKLGSVGLAGLVENISTYKKPFRWARFWRVVGFCSVFVVFAGAVVWAVACVIKLFIIF